MEENRKLYLKLINEMKKIKEWPYFLGYVGPIKFLKHGYFKNENDDSILPLELLSDDATEDEFNYFVNYYTSMYMELANIFTDEEYNYYYNYKNASYPNKEE